MFESIVQAFPENWQTFAKLVLSLVAWIPPVQEALLSHAVYSASPVSKFLKWVFLLLPFLLAIIGLWVTMLSIYTYPFRRNRNVYFAIIFIAWWDSLRAVWLFWVGAFHFLWLAVGWFWGMLRIAVGVIIEILRQIIYYPFMVTRGLGARYFRPGIPWIAVFITLFWVFFEAMIFTYILSPTIFEILSNLVGVESHTYLNPALFIFLSVLIGGSFACIYWLGEAVKNRDIVQIISMTVWELCVVFVEVMFLYRDLVDAITPWLAQQSGDQLQLGLFGTLFLATFAWVGIRAMTWFLFARYGISTLIAIIARQEIKGDTGRPEKQQDVPYDHFKGIIDKFKADTDWFHKKGKEILEAMALPALQVIAAGINFLMIFWSSRPIFSLPFKHIEEVMETQELMKTIEQQMKGKD